MEQLKSFEEIIKPDDQHSLIDQVTGTRLILRSLYSAIEEIELNESVPEKIRSQFNVARNLAIYTWYSYSFDPGSVAENLCPDWARIEHQRWNAW